MEDKEQTKFEKKEKKTHPIEHHNFISNLFFCWALSFFVKKFKKNLTADDLFEPLKVHESRRLGDRLEDAWSIETKHKKNPSLWKAIARVFGKEFAVYGVVLVIMESVKAAQPILIERLLNYYTSDQKKMSKNMAYIYAFLLVTVTLTFVIIIHSYIFGLMHLGMKIRVACCSLIYRKSLRLSKSAMAETTVGQMVNLLSNDVNRFDYAFLNLHNFWLAPLETIILAYILYSILGPPAITGLGILMIFVPLQMYLGKISAVYRMRTAVKTDQRVRLMNEIISGIQVIKMYTWEKPFAKLVEKARKLEIHQIKYASYLRALNLSLATFLNRISIFSCILTYILTGNKLNAQYVYVVTSFYENIRQALSMFLHLGIPAMAESHVSVKRIQKFLLYDEIEKLATERSVMGKVMKSNGIYSLDHEENVFEKEEIGIQMDNVSVKWIKTSPEYSLINVTFHAKNRQLIAVVGTVGSGKSTLLHVILKELTPINGDLAVNGTISYASQEPWLFTGSVKQNILFGQEMNLKRYQKVIKVCALERDFALFPYGDRTNVGERGVILSGGQKARISLARAIYKKADIYLLDDPLSAVDAHVGRELYDNCIQGFLSDKCTILVTHQLQYLRDVQRIYLLENGNIKASGTYSELQEEGGEYLQFLQDDPNNKEDETGKEIDDMSSKPISDEIDSRIEMKEEQSIGQISDKTYGHYAKSGGNWFVCLLIASIFVITQILVSGTDYFLTFWVNLEQKRATQVAEFDESLQSESIANVFFTSYNCMYIYTGLILFIIVMPFIRSMSFFKFCMTASINLHNKMFGSVVYTSMRFFNTNPSGRILNRFSKDMGSIDEILPQTVTDTIQIALAAFAVTLVICTINPWILIPTVILFGLFYTYRIVYLSSSRDIKRIEGITRSPVFSHLTASLQGLTTIRAFGAQPVLMDEFDNHQDFHSSAFYLFMGCSRAFAFWLDFTCGLYIAVITFSFLLIGTEIYGGNVGLAITQAITLTGMLQWGIRQWSEMDNQMTSVERVVEYMNLPPEISDNSKKPPNGWPSEGNLDFDGVSMQYSTEDPFVLKELSFIIKAHEKVGIVGRTGAGKSSLISALFRLVKIEGRILIDGVNISSISLDSLRAKISIIPQEPVLFSGTLRKNLDPFDEFADEQIWNALEEVELKVAISDLSSGLQSLVSEGGSNFSVGQRQLLCLARAVIRSNKILVMDEATANVDPQTDELIQRTIRRKFKNCTVLTIAHRLHTVMDSDKVLVMDAGRAVEFDHPHVLLQNTEGIFYALVQKTGRGMAENLRIISEQNYGY